MWETSEDLTEISSSNRRKEENDAEKIVVVESALVAVLYRKREKDSSRKSLFKHASFAVFNVPRIHIYNRTRSQKRAFPTTHLMLF